MSGDYRTEFPDFDPSTMPEIPEGWEDVSWRNDACPCFQAPNELLVFVDYLDVEKRMFRHSVLRFAVIDLATNGSMDTDSWEEVKEFVSKHGVDNPPKV